MRGHLDYTEEQRERLLREWDRATMTNVGIKIDEDALFKWVEWIRTLSQKLNKSPRQERKKFLSGMPVGFTDAIMAEKLEEPDGHYRYPNHYPAHHPNAGAAVPGHLADRPDIMEAAMAFYPEWCSRIHKGTLKPLPRQSVHVTQDEDSFDWGVDQGANAVSNSQTDSPTSTDDEDAHRVDRYDRKSTKSKATKIAWNVVCACCGGLGHFARVGNRRCLTSEIGNNQPEEKLKEIRYPDGIARPSFGSTSKSASIATSRRSTRTKERSTRRDPKQKHKDKSRRPSASAHANNPESDPSSSDSEVQQMSGMVIDYDDIRYEPPPPPSLPPSPPQSNHGDDAGEPEGAQDPRGPADPMEEQAHTVSEHGPSTLTAQPPSTAQPGPSHIRSPSYTQSGSSTTALDDAGPARERAVCTCVPGFRKACSFCKWVQDHFVNAVCVDTAPSMTTCDEDEVMLNRIDPNAFILDTGATIHCVNDKSLFESIDENKNEIKVTVANGEKLNISTQGSIRISLVDTRGKAHSYMLHNVCYHPRFKENLISVGRLWDDTKIQCTFGSECILHDTCNGFKFDATRDEKRHYRVALTEGSTPSPFAWTLHNRLGHCSVRRIKLLFENTIGVDTSSVSTLRDNAFHDCVACRAGKSVKKPVQTENERNKKVKRSANSEGVSEEPKYTYFGQLLSSA